MAASAIILNGVTVYAKDRKLEEIPIGVAFVALNGSPRFAQRAIKRTWSLEFDHLTIAQLTALRGIHALTTSFTLVDENSVSYTVVRTDAALSSNVALITPDGTAYYAATLVVQEA
jgi:hypothetical protein